MHRRQHNRISKFVALAATAMIAVAMMAFGAPSASAVTHTVQVPAGQNLFSPQNLGTITVGDTITWKNNDFHNVVSANIPAGATAFSSPFLSGPAATFSVTVTVPGNYRYLCTLHSNPAEANAATQSATQMVGQFTVVGAPAPGPTSTVVPTVTPTMPPMPSMPPTVAPTVAPPVAAATPRTVQIPAGQNLFTPQDLGTINVGDTITWKNNDVHNVVSANIPAGATAFQSPIMAGPAATFSVTVTSPGNYRYLCTLHSTPAEANAATQSPTQMVGQFTVVGTAIPPIPAGTSAGGTTSSGTSAAGTGATGSQVDSFPVGGVQAGGGSTAGFSPSWLMTLGGGLLMAAFMSALRSRRLARQESAR